MIGNGNGWLDGGCEEDNDGWILIHDVRCTTG